MNFKCKHTFNERIKESMRVKFKYPTRIPIICEKSIKSNMDTIDKNKYLVQDDITCGQFIYVIRQRLKLPPEKAIFLFVNGTIPCTSDGILHIYKKEKDKDGFLYIKYSDENVFG